MKESTENSDWWERIKEQRGPQAIAVSTCAVLGTVDTGIQKTDTEKLFACEEFALIPEKTRNEMMTK